MRDFIIAGLLAILFMAVVTGTVVGVVTWGTSVSCDNFAQLNPEQQFHYDFWTGCTMKLDNGFWISTNNIVSVNGELQVIQK